MPVSHTARFWIVFLSTLTVIVLGSASVMLWGMYARQWDSPFVASASRAFPVPAARLGSRTVLYRSYLDSVRSVETYLKSDEAKSLDMSRAITDEDRKNALERLLREAALEDLALARKVTVSDEQMNAAFAEFSAGATSTADLEALLRDNFGWTIDDLKLHLIRPALLTRLLAASYAADHGNDPNALEKYLDERVQRPDVVRYVKF